MNFIEALEELNKGKRIYRKEWRCSRFLQKINFEGEEKICSFEEILDYYHFSLSIIQTNDWIFYNDEDKNTFSFVEAIEHLKSKKLITNKTWEEDNYLSIDRDGQLMIRRIVTSSFIPNFTCLSSNDWEVLK